MNKTLRLFFCLFLLLVAAGCASSSEPENTAPSMTQIAAPTSSSASHVTATASVPLLPTQIPAIDETRRLTLEFPSRMRAGAEADTIRLTLEVDDLGNLTPTAEFAGNVVVGETIQIPNLYDTHQVTAEARFDIAGMEVQPAGPIYEPLKRGQPATFYWSIRPPEAGKYRGTVWLHLGFENRSTGEKDRVAVSAQIIEIEAVDFFGMSVNIPRVGGIVGSAVSGVLGFPFLEDLIKFLISRMKKQRKQVKKHS